MKVQELREILRPLNAEAMRRLAGQLDIEGRTKADLRDSIASKYARRPSTVVDQMRRDDIYQCLKDWTCETDNGSFSFTNLSSAPLSDLRAAARRLWVETWRPSRNEERVIVGSGITAQLLDDPDETAETNDESTSLIFQTDSEEDSDAPIERLAYEDIPTLIDANADGTQKGLAPFQQEAVSKLTRRLDSGRRRALLCLPTGGGKTRTALHLLLTRYIAEGRTVLWVTHRVDLLDQVHEEVRESVWQISKRRSHVRVSHVYGGAADTSGDFILASSMALVRNESVLAALKRDRNLSIVVYDEAHRLVAKGTWAAIQRLLQGDRALLALTATPYRKDPRETEQLERAVGKPAYYRSFGDLLQAGFLARPVFLRQRVRSTESMRLSETDARETKRTGDYAPSVLAALARHRQRDQEIVSHWCTQQKQYGKTIAFACDIEHAEQLAGAFRRHGVSSEALHSGHSPERRQRTLADFRAGSTRVLVNVGILTEGTNVPDTRTVLLARPTLSRSLYMQMIGRGARGPNVVQGKTVFYVIDCVDNFQQHGFISAGAEVARELEDAMRLVDQANALANDSEGSQSSSPAIVPRLEISRSCGADGALRLLLRGLTPSAYTLWGELRWGRGAAGVSGSAAVFLETHGHVEVAIQRLRTAKSNGRFDRMDAEGIQLDALGALRREEWTAAWTSYRDYGMEPDLVESGARCIDPHDINLAERIESLIHNHPEHTAEDWREYLLRDDVIRDDLQPVFGDVDACASLLERVSLDYLSVRCGQEEIPTDTIPIRSFEQDARDFSTIAFALLPPGAGTAPRESRIIDISCGLLFGLGASPPTYPGNTTDEEISSAAARLGDGITSDRGAEEMDHLLRVVLADELVSERERRVLRLVAPYLGVPEEVLTGRLAGIDEPDDEVARELQENSGNVTCHVCNEVLPEDSRFCGVCGNPLTRTISTAVDAGGSHQAYLSQVTAVPPAAPGELHPDGAMDIGADSTANSPALATDQVICTCCRTAWPLGTRFCGACSSSIDIISTADRQSKSLATNTISHELNTTGQDIEPPRFYLSGNPRAGFAAEDWLKAELIAQFGSSQVHQNVAPFGRGQSDFVVSCRGAEFHIELKHVSSRHGVFHWSLLQMELTRSLALAGHAYALVIAHPLPGGDYQLFWCNDPCTVFHSAPKTTVFHYTHVMEHERSMATFGWHRDVPALDILNTRWTISFTIRLDDSCYRSMRMISAGECHIAPVVEWSRRIFTD